MLLSMMGQNWFCSDRMFKSKFLYEVIADATFLVNNVRIFTRSVNKNYTLTIQLNL